MRTLHKLPHALPTHGTLAAAPPFMLSREVGTGAPAGALGSERRVCLSRYFNWLRVARPSRLGRFIGTERPPGGKRGVRSCHFETPCASLIAFYRALGGWRAALPFRLIHVNEARSGCEVVSLPQPAHDVVVNFSGRCDLEAVHVMATAIANDLLPPRRGSGPSKATDNTSGA